MAASSPLLALLKAPDARFVDDVFKETFLSRRDGYRFTHAPLSRPLYREKEPRESRLRVSLRRCVQSFEGVSGQARRLARYRGDGRRGGTAYRAILCPHETVSKDARKLPRAVRWAGVCIELYLEPANLPSFVGRSSTPRANSSGIQLKHRWTPAKCRRHAVSSLRAWHAMPCGTRIMRRPCTTV